jgi:hypothetical protein
LYVPAKASSAVARAVEGLMSGGRYAARGAYMITATPRRQHAAPIRVAVRPEPVEEHAPRQ